MFKKRNWSKWRSIRFVEDFRGGIKVYELLRREDLDTGLVEWKRVYVKDCVHNLAELLN
jgi:hypothetical protein